MDKRWYVVNTYSGHEKKVKEKLEMKIESMNLQDIIYRIVIPEQEEIEVKNGVEKKKLKKLFPGYILVEMVMTDEAWFIVRNTPGVTGFIGSSGKGAKPTPLQPYEVDKVLSSMGMSRLENTTDLKEGELVKLISGPFNGMEGKIESIDLKNNTINVLLDLFGQETSVEALLSQIEKA